ncbi:MAG TPA: SPW repeat protein [Candidatus Eisenbacteria bacterium]|nr:SPW repeat protein [Candidatus Eisenbacteria bacterium]
MIASKRWQDWASALLGVLLFFSPFVFSTTTNTNASWTAYLIGVLAFLAGVTLLVSQTFRIVEYGLVLLGVLLFISPWVLGFAALASMAWTAWIIGIALFILAGSVIAPDLTERRQATTA